MYCACHAKGSQEALWTAPATRSQPRVGAAAPPGGCVYCATRSQPRPSGAHAGRSSSRRLCVLRLPSERQPGNSLYCACHAKPAAAQRATTRAATPPGGSVYCACHAKPAVAQRRPRAPQLLQEALCTAPAKRKAARKLSVLRLPREASRGTAAPTCAAAPPGGSVYCACHAKGSQEALWTAPATRSQPRPSGPPCAPQLLQEALCTAPATRKAARKVSVLRLPHERQPR